VLLVLLVLSFFPGPDTLNPLNYIFFWAFFSSSSTLFIPAVIEFIFCLFFSANVRDSLVGYSLLYFFVPLGWFVWFTVHLLVVDYATGLVLVVLVVVYLAGYFVDY
jgi:hypothetical protein